MATIISILIAAVLAILLVDRILANRKLSERMAQQQETNLELLKRIPVTDAGSAEGPKPLTVDTIAEAIRMEGYMPEKQEDGVAFKIQGDSYFVDAERLPLLFLIKGYNVDPNDWDIDLLQHAAHLMSDDLAIVKATFADDNKHLNFLIAAQDRNYESFRLNLSTYLRMLENGEQKLSDHYHRMEDEQKEASLSAQPIIPPARQDNKVMS